MEGSGNGYSGCVGLHTSESELWQEGRILGQGGPGQRRVQATLTVVCALLHILRGSRQPANLAVEAGGRDGVVKLNGRRQRGWSAR
jgi:hypothetical protein